MTTNTHPELPPMPDTDKKMVLPYTAIRYVAGYPESYVKEYARAYALLCSNAALEEATNAIEAIRNLKGDMS